MAQALMPPPCNVGQYLEKISFLRYGIKFEMKGNIKLKFSESMKSKNGKYLYFKCPMDDCTVHLNFIRKGDIYQFMSGCFTHIHTTSKELKKIEFTFLRLFLSEYIENGGEKSTGLSNAYENLKIH